MSKLTIEYSIKGRFLELIANANILPGMLLERCEEGEIKPHALVDGTAPPIIAVEDKLAGKSIVEAYEIDSNVHCRYCLPGDVFMGLVEDITIERGDFLSSAGDGKLKKIPFGTLSDRTIVGRALAALATEEVYSYFAINGLSLEEVYAQAENFYYARGQEIVTLDNFIPVEII